MTAHRWSPHRPPGSGPRRDEGQSLVGALAGVGVFLGFLFFAVHLVVGLHATSVVTAHAYDAARRVAAADIDHADPLAVTTAQRRAEADVRAALGRYSSRVEPFDWSGTDAEAIRLRVRAESPSFLVLVDGVLGVEEIDRTVTVRVERVR